jgi:hypothetical protein
MTSRKFKIIFPVFKDSGTEYKSGDFKTLNFSVQIFYAALAPAPALILTDLK